MDTADKYINNRTPRRIVLLSLIMCAVLTAVSFFISDCLAEKITADRIKAVAAASGGNTEYLAIPSEEAVAAGDAVLSQYGINSDISPRVFEAFRMTRKMIFIPMALLSVLLCVSGAAVSLVPLFAVYSEMEKLSEECYAISEKGGAVKGKYGETFSCLRRVSEGISMIGKSMEHNISTLSSDREFLRDFLTDFSHQLKTSLAVVRLNNDMLETLDNLTEEKSDQLSAEINSAIDDMESLVYSALRLARLNADSVRYEMKEGSLSDVCRKAVLKVNPLLSAKKISVIENTDRKVVYSFDDVWLTEALVNLIKNSADHSGCTEISISLEATPQTAVISVSDNGKGIPQSAIPGIFRRFGKVSRSSGMSSVGIGMSVADKIVQAHNGEILVFSGEGRGTRFDIVLLK